MEMRPERIGLTWAVCYDMTKKSVSETVPVGRSSQWSTTTSKARPRPMIARRIIAVEQLTIEAQYLSRPPAAQRRNANVPLESDAKVAEGFHDLEEVGKWRNILGLGALTSLCRGLGFANATCRSWFTNGELSGNSPTPLIFMTVSFKSSINPTEYYC